MRLTIKKRLLLGFGMLSLILMGLGIYAIFSLNTVNGKTTEIAEEWLPSVDYAHSINTATANFRIKEYKHVLSATQEEMSSLEQEMDELNDEITKNIEGYQTVISGEVDRKIINSVTAEWDNYLQIHQKVLSLSRALKSQEAVNLMNGESKAAYDTISNGLLELVKYNQDGSGQASKNASAVYSSTRSILIVVILIAVIICIGASLMITNSIVKPVNKLIGVADRLALGDVNVAVEATTKDEIGNLMESFGRMVENIREQAFAAEKIAAGDLTVQVKVKSDDDLLGKKLSEMIETNNEILTNISSASDQVAAGARQVSASSQMLSQGSTEQASAIEEITSSMTQVAAQTKQNAVNANQANELALTAKDIAISGNGQMQGMVKAMAEINDSSSNISKIIKVIDEIAFQTNILALNAAVEAARAGQHGKGFAVVAEEVRNLAARSANAAKETTEMIENSIKKVGAGTQIANSTAEALDKIVDGVAKAATLVGEIAVASNEQATGIAQINQAISQVAQVVQTNSATAEESAAASEELSSQADLLKSAVSRFNLKTGKSKLSLEDGVSPDMMRMIEEVLEKKRSSRHLEQGAGDFAEAAAAKEVPGKIKISLEDHNFGKY
ncbi:methyl-accepting chemotaxis protein [Candidatus Formimonas warabiya]|uniref:Methyl-accepting chemotaxis protein n=1 Tax=Formimonas warabiya TaxID=1761012 RepID=A0A3G1KY71_FORW1|nr:methyl-accepting chemotaxis protein [Candidatus Formimonas warabiya]ATW27463.1 methyl-accepting chemotaxis protein [Candidatus Formimonas warabiya]